MTNRRNKASIIIGGVDYSKYLAFPFVFQDTGTEQLDSAIVSLRNLPTDRKFAPFTAVSLMGGKYTYVIADDRVTAVFGRSLWHHELTLIEETKMLERILMEGKSFTQPLETEKGAEVSTVYKFESNKFENPSTRRYYGINTPIKISTSSFDFVAPSVTELNALYQVAKDDIDGSWELVVLYSKNALGFVGAGDYDKYDIVYQSAIAEYDEYPTVQITKTGVYTFIYRKEGHGLFFIPLSFYNAYDAPPKYSIYDVMQITLETAEPIFKGEAPRYGLSLTTDQETRYKAMDAPEMYFPNGRSLYENLKEIGDYIHAIPRLKNKKIYWQELGDVKRASLSNGILYGASGGYNAAEYASAVEANFANLINASDEAEGSVTEPYANGYITLRSNGYRIKEGEGYIPTNFPIGTKIKQVLVNIYDDEGNKTDSVDITPAVLEKNEYDLLSNYSGTYPFSKTHALYYTTGQKNIDGLWYRAEDNPISFMNQFSNYAITNILNFFGNSNKNSYDYTKLAFQVTYIPIINGRARQERIESTAERVILAHNQSANQLSAKAFGENLRGKVAMLGNATESKLYVFPTVDDIPKGGEKYDNNKFISLVTTKVFPDYCLSQLDLTENYNALGAFVQMKTGIRQYEIPQGQERYTLLEEFCVIGKEETTHREKNLLCNDLLCEQTIRAFSLENKNTKDITTVWAETYDENNTQISQTLSLPVYSTSIGTSVFFGFSFADNYSAGGKSIDIGKPLARGMEFVEYGTPFYSRAKYLDFIFVNTFNDVSNELDAANRLPVTNDFSNEQFISTSGTGKLILNKDGADVCSIAYQLHFVSNDGYIIGSELARMMPYVRTHNENNQAPKVYFYNTEVDELTGEAHGDIVAESPLYVGWEQSYFLRIEEMPTDAYKSFVIKRPGGACIIGKNTDNADQVIHFNFKRRR